jgi:hypothetical protein
VKDQTKVIESNLRNWLREVLGDRVAWIEAARGGTVGLPDCLIKTKTMANLPVELKVIHEQKSWPEVYDPTGPGPIPRSFGQGWAENGLPRDRGGEGPLCGQRRPWPSYAPPISGRRLPRIRAAMYKVFVQENVSMSCKGLRDSSAHPSGGGRSGPNNGHSVEIFSKEKDFGHFG